ncbi:MAG: hypothetical protein GY913_23945 [Proteobacteria bacterium]|nr:hypothetical protein [Pseudomonadota bacterium]MCP4919967.1 hypothetical protein [Pseudomonadota bacterium]
MSILLTLSLFACNGDPEDSGQDSVPPEDTGCDAPVLYSIDADNDGFGSTDYQESSCTGAPSGYVEDATDCDDLDALVFPGAEETCNGIDDNCDGTADEGLEGTTFYADTDGDGYGDETSTSELCTIADGWVEDATDCDDTTDAISPDAEEVCGDGIDNDCDGTAGTCGLADELLATEARTILLGESEGDQFGSPARSVGDTDANGLEELAVGARGSDLGADGAGAIYLFGLPMTGGTQSAADADAVLVGEAENDQAFAAIGVGDSNGDGKGDLVVGAKKNDDGGSDAGKIYFMHGPFSGQHSLGDATATWTGVGAGDQAGTLSVGDMNGDGEMDVLVSAQKNDNGGTDAGAAFVLNGPFGAWMGDRGLYSADAFLRGNAGEQAGGGLAYAGDVNGDGIGDMIVGAPYQTVGGVEDGGAVYLLHGPVSGTGDLDSAADVHFVANSGGDEAGWGLASAGDLDGDGSADFMVNAQRDDMRDDNANEGAIYVVTGDWSSSEGTVDLDSTWMKIYGMNTEDKLASVNGGGDLNGDGHIDLVVGTRFHDAGGDDAGAAWLLYGPFTGGTVEVEDLAQTRVDGKGDSDGLAAPAGLIGDHNEDGYDELAIGARWNDDAGSDAGAAYLFRGAGL